MSGPSGLCHLVRRRRHRSHVRDLLRKPDRVLHDSGARRVVSENQSTVVLVRHVLDTSTLLGDRLVAVARMDYDGAAPNLASLAAAGTGVTALGHTARAGELLEDLDSFKPAHKIAALGRDV
jgi:hypothetical protein